jgi:hypothetical protein
VRDIILKGLLKEGNQKIFKGVGDPSLRLIHPLIPLAMPAFLRATYHIIKGFSHSNLKYCLVYNSSNPAAAKLLIGL